MLFNVDGKHMFNKCKNALPKICTFMPFETAMSHQAKYALPMAMYALPIKAIKCKYNLLQKGSQCKYNMPEKDKLIYEATVLVEGAVRKELPKKFIQCKYALVNKGKKYKNALLCRGMAGKSIFMQKEVKYRCILPSHGNGTGLIQDFLYRYCCFKATCEAISFIFVCLCVNPVHKTYSGFVKLLYNTSKQ